MSIAAKRNEDGDFDGAVLVDGKFSHSIQAEDAQKFLTQLSGNLLDCADNWAVGAQILITVVTEK